MSVNKFIELFKEEFEADIIDSVSLSDDKYKSIDIFGVIKTNAIEILSDDTEAFKEAKVKWVEEFFQDAKLYVEGIGNIWQNQARFDQLINDVEKGNIVPFVGSGMSVKSGFMTWVDFLKYLQQYSDVDDARFDYLSTERKFDELASELCDSMDSTMNAEILGNTFRIPTDQVRLRLDGAVCIIPTIFKDLIVTTNYDNVLETVLQNFNVHFEKMTGLRIEDYQPAALGGARILLKLHGDALNLNSRVLTKAEYDVAYAPDSKYVRVLADLYSANQFLFLGCSLNGDRTLDVFRLVFSEEKVYKKHYAFLPVGTDLVELADINKHVKEKDDYLRTMGIYPIWYSGEHDDAILHLLVALLARVGIE